MGMTTELDQWQPIATAPKDATRVLFWGPMWRCPFVGRASFTDHMALLDLPTPTATYQEVFATHWMPLPAPPVTKPEDEEKRQ